MPTFAYMDSDGIDHALDTEEAQKIFEGLSMEILTTPIGSWQRQLWLLGWAALQVLRQETYNDPVPPNAESV